MDAAAAAWVERYLAHLRAERRLSPHTESNYRRDLAALSAWCDAAGLPDWRRLDSQHVRTFAASQHRGGQGRVEKATGQEPQQEPQPIARQGVARRGQGAGESRQSGP